MMSDLIRRADVLAEINAWNHYEAGTAMSTHFLIQRIKHISFGVPTTTEQKALELIRHLKDRPCEACEYHGEHGCCKWSCVFDEMIIYSKNKGGEEG